MFPTTLKQPFKQLNKYARVFTTVSETQKYPYPAAHNTRYTTNQQNVKQTQTHSFKTTHALKQQTATHSRTTDTATDDTTTVAVQPNEFTSIKAGLLPITLVDVQNTFGTIHEIAQADTLCTQGHYSAAVPLLKRAVEISVGLRDSLVAVYAHMLLARCYYLSNDLVNERYERNEIIKLLDQLIKETKNRVYDKRKMNNVSTSTTFNLLNDSIMFKQSICSYAINLLRLHEYQQCIDLINTWSMRAEEYNAYDARIRAKAILGMIYTMQHNAIQAERMYEDMYTIAHENMLSDKTLVEADSYVLLGLLYKYVRKNETKANKYWTKAVKLYESYPTLVVPLDAGGIQLPIVYSLLYLNTEDTVKYALEISEKYLGITHWLSIDCVRVLAGLYRNTDPLTAEGLYRTALNRIDNPTPYVQQAEYWYVLSDVIVDYCDLLHHMKWNNKPRTAEANKLMERLYALQKQHPHIKPTVRHVTQPELNSEESFELQANTEPFIPSWFYERFTA